MHTDLPRSEAVRMAQALEESRRALVSMAWSEAPPIEGRTEAAVFADSEEFHRYYRQPGTAGVLVGAPGRVPLLAVPWTPDENDGLPEYALHEITHDLDRWTTPVGPRWLREGMATYLQGTRYDAERDQFVFGELPSDMENQLRSFDRELLPIRELWAAPGTYHEGNTWRFYFTTWLLTLWLQNHRQHDFAAFRRELAATHDWQQAWQGHLSDLTAERLDVELARYMAGGQFQRRARRLRKVEHVVHVKSLSRAQGLGVSSWLAYQLFHHALAKGQAERALALDPTDHYGLLTRYHLAPEPEPGMRRATSNQTSFPEAEPENSGAIPSTRYGIARRLVAAHPNSGEAWLALSLASTHAPEREAALERAHARLPHHPGVRAELARVALERGQHARARVETQWLMRRVAVTADLVRLHTRALGGNRQCGEATSFVGAWLSLHSTRHADGRVLPGYFSGVLEEAGCSLSARARQELWSRLAEARPEAPHSGGGP